MGFRYSKRIGGHKKGFGLNVSSSGVSSSYRSKYGSICPKGFSIRTSVPGLTFRSNFGSNKKGKNDAITGLFVMLIIGAFTVAALIVYNLVQFLSWGTSEIYHFILRKKNSASKLTSEETVKEVIEQN